MSLNFKNKNALITGGCGYIGSATAKQLSQLGCNLILIDIDKLKLNKLKINLEKKSNVKINILEADLADNNNINHIYNYLIKNNKKLDIMINAIGMVGTNNIMGWNTSFDKQKVEPWNNSIQINLTSIFFLIQKIYKLMNKSKNPAIVNVSSIYGVHAPDWDIYKDTSINNPAAYSISKAGVVHMTKWLASTLAPQIRVNCISPGGLLRDQPKKFIKKYETKTLLNRMASEEDIIKPILFLASNMSSYITGQNIIVDGGWTIK